MISIHAMLNSRNLEFLIKSVRFMQNHLKIQSIISRPHWTKPKQYTPQMANTKFTNQEKGMGVPLMKTLEKSNEGCITISRNKKVI